MSCGQAGLGVFPKEGPQLFYKWQKTSFLFLPSRNWWGTIIPGRGRGRGETGSSQVSLYLGRADQQRVLCKALGVHCSQTWGEEDIQGKGQQKPCPYPQSRTGAMGPNLAAEKHGSTEKRRQEGEQQAGPPRSPEKRGRSLKALTQGPKGSLSSMQPGRGAAWQVRHPLPQGHGYCIGHGFC